MTHAYVEGAPVDWAGFDRGYGRRKLALPTYPFQRERYWVDGAVAGSGVESMYEVEWQASATDASSETASALPLASRRFLVLADGSGVGSALARSLSAQGASATTVSALPGLAGAIAIDPDDRDGFRDLLNRLPPSDAPTDVIYLWALDGAGESTAPVESIDRAQRSGCHGLLHLSRALIERTGAPPRVWIVTRGAQAAGAATPLAVSQSPVWGFGRVLSLEHPELQVRLIDLEPEDAEQEAVVLASELTRADSEDSIAFRGRRRLVARLAAARPLTGSPVSWSPDASYLVTGGLGSLGLRVATWMVDRGARHLVLIGRRGLDVAAPGGAAAASAIAGLERRGATVTVVAADVADELSMTRAFDDIARTPFPLRGIVHAAGVTALTAVADLDAPALDAVLRSKVPGAWLLHRLSEKLPLDFFVMFSSIASVWGARGLASYAAANQFLDALAHHRRALGLPALAVNWGPWAGGGMTSDEGRAALGAMGVHALDPAAALLKLDVLMAGSRTQTTVARVDWGEFKSIYQSVRVRHLLDLVGTASAPAKREVEQDAAVLERLRAAHPAERMALLESWAQEELAAVLGNNLAGAPEPDARFFDLGMDSLTSVELRRRLERRFGCSLEPTLVFDFPTIERLAAHLADRLGLSPATVPAAAAAPVDDDPMRRITEMSDEDVERLFAEKVLNQGT